MTVEIVVPSLGESITEATVMQWYKKVGDPVNSGEKVVELETDKVNVDVSADKNGTLVKIEHPEGEDVKVGEVLGVLDENTTSPGKNGGGKSEPAQAADTKETNQPEVKNENPPETRTVVEKISPIARRVAEENGVDVAELAKKMPGQRITKEDVEEFLDSQKKPSQQTIQPAAQPQTKPVAEESAAAEVPAPTLQPDLEERVLMSRRRRTIAERLVQAQHAAAMLTTFNDVNMAEVMKIRQRRKEEFQKKFGIGLGITSFFVKASVMALKESPLLNSEIQGDTIIIKHYYDIGVAVGSEEGLVVPVIRGADKLSFADIEKSIRDYVKKVESGALSIDDLRGGTFTITNGGVYGSLLSTPILNAPQVAILGLHRIEDRPVASDGQVVIQPMMYMALSYDHRVIDGRDAVLFLKRIKEIIESPELLLFG